MKTILIILLTMLLFSCKNPVNSNARAADDNSPTVCYQYKISGMTCTGCETTIQASVGKLDGIRSVNASFEKGEALIEFNPELTDTSAVKSNINSTGYLVVGIFACRLNSFQ